MHLSHLFTDSCQRHAQRFFHPQFSFHDLYRKSSAYLYYLQHHLKILPQQRIMLRAPKSYRWAPFLLACFRNNNVVIPVPPHSIHENHFIRLSQPKIIIDSLQPFEECTWTTSMEIKDHSFDVQSPAFILFTSGSTTQPKGVVLSHSNIYHNLRQIDSVLQSLVDEQDCSYSLLPWYHCYGLICELLFSMMKGSQILLSERQNPLDQWKQMASFQPTVVQLVPKMMYGMEKWINESLLFRWSIPSFRRRLLFGSNIRLLTLGGASCLPSTMESVHRSFDIPIYQGYGMTEMSPMVSFSTHPNDYDSVGSILPSIHHQIDPITQELHVNGPNLMLGYLQDILSDQTLSCKRPWSNEHPWYATGDQASVKSQTLSIVGRTLDVYKMANGKFINPLFLESLLEKHPFIQQCFIFSLEGVYNQALIYSREFSSNGPVILSCIHSILKDHHISSSLWPRQIQFLKTPFSMENECLSIKHEKRRSHILSKWKEETLDLFP